MERHLFSYYIGILIIYLTHLLILVYPNYKMDMKTHAYINIVGVWGIAYYFMYKENYIKF